MVVMMVVSVVFGRRGRIFRGDFALREAFQESGSFVFDHRGFHRFRFGVKVTKHSLEAISFPLVVFRGGSLFRNFRDAAEGRSVRS